MCSSWCRAMLQRGDLQKGQKPVCLRFASATVTAIRSAPAAKERRQQQQQQHVTATASATAVAVEEEPTELQQKKISLLQFLCLLEQQIFLWCSSTSLEHYSLACDPAALQAAAAAAGRSRSAAVSAASDGHVPFWEYMLEIKPPEMPLEEFVV